MKVCKNRAIGPGPGKYLLPPVVGYPNHDVRKQRYPQYSIGKRLGFSSKDISPGPSYKVDKLTNYGKVSVPAYSIKPRLQPVSTFQTPGPAHYLPNYVEGWRAPKYTIKAKVAGVTPYESPGPNKYMLPTTIGPKVPDLPANSAFTMPPKLGLTGHDLGPGPGKYPGTDINVYKNKLPKYTIPSRTPMPSAKTVIPGPKYFPQLAKKPGYSFGMRTCADPYITTDDYNIPCNRRVKNC